MASPPSAVTVEVRVELKAGILDAEADSVQKSLALLGLGPVRSVRTAKVFTIEYPDTTAERAEALAREAVDKLLANPVIHHVTVTVRTS